MDAWTRKDRLELPKARRQWWKKKRFAVPGWSLVAITGLAVAGNLMPDVPNETSLPMAERPTSTQTASPEPPLPDENTNWVQIGGTRDVTREVTEIVSNLDIDQLGSITSAEVAGSSLTIHTTIKNQGAEVQAPESTWVVEVCNAMLWGGFEGAAAQVKDAAGSTIAGNTRGISDGRICAAAGVAQESPDSSVESVTDEVVAAVSKAGLPPIAEVLNATLDRGSVTVQTSVVDPRGPEGSPEGRWAAGVCQAVVDAGISDGGVSVREADGTTFATTTRGSTADGSCIEY